jgi:scpA/B protein
MELLYKLEHFEGPLDLLLHLIEKDKINIYDIPIVHITNQYLEYVRQMGEDVELMSEFLVMAATLLDIKARMLLPRRKDEDEGEEADPRAELVERLIEYKKCKIMARELADMEFDGERHLYKAPNIPKEVHNYKQPFDLDELFADIKIDKLKEIYEQILKKQDFRIDKQRSSFGTIKKEPISLEQKIHFVLEQVRLRRKLSFKSILINAKSRLDVVVSFLAILELMKLSRLKVVQESIGDEIMLISTEGTSEFEDIDLSKIEELI